MFCNSAHKGRLRGRLYYQRLGVAIDHSEQLKLNLKEISILLYPLA